ncbi:acetyl-CoA carboxylase biotin carboxyl carrier protein [Thomasclavelia saccharogumia]|uniref:acetyl-CoA carboxylase biotin carboxyl carrier protein n=1 Tax=Thomasclavelia saccharogumia TaxID=341225 RepID=UPI00047C5CE4|nr:acetyl-CoA carboxylase biotin carboxyl carrier protein [Thomasclavelia saccharogumia]
MKIDLVKQLINEFENSEVFKMKVEIDDIKLELEKAPAAPVNVVNSEATVLPVSPTPVSSTSAPLEAVKEPAITGTPIKSPIVGVYYAASSPAAKPYVEVGSKVKAGQVLCIVEAMKVMNEIKSPIDGTVSAIMAETEDLVEYDQVLMVIEG